MYPTSLLVASDAHINIFLSRSIASYASELCSVITSEAKSQLLPPSGNKVQLCFVYLAAKAGERRLSTLLHNFLVIVPLLRGP